MDKTKSASLGPSLAIAAEHPSDPPSATDGGWAFQELQAGGTPGSQQPDLLSPAAEGGSSDWTFVQLPAQAQPQAAVSQPPQAAVSLPSGAGGAQPAAAANATGPPQLGRAFDLALTGREGHGRAGSRGSCCLGRQKCWGHPGLVCRCLFFPTNACTSAFLIPAPGPAAEALPSPAAEAPQYAAAVAAPPPQRLCWVQAVTDFQGGDLGPGNQTCCQSAADCCNTCWGTPGCGAWTYRAADVSWKSRTWAAAACCASSLVAGR